MYLHMGGREIRCDTIEEGERIYEIILEIERRKKKFNEAHRFNRDRICIYCGLPQIEIDCHNLECHKKKKQITNPYPIISKLQYADLPYQYKEWLRPLGLVYVHLPKSDKELDSIEKIIGELKTKLIEMKATHAFNFEFEDMDNFYTLRCEAFQILVTENFDI